MLKHLNSGVGTCVEQVNIIKLFLDKLGIPNKLFCNRLYKDESFNDDKVFQIEQPHSSRVGIFEYKSEEDAINFLNDRYEKMTINVKINLLKKVLKELLRSFLILLQD